MNAFLSYVFTALRPVNTFWTFLAAGSIGAQGLLGFPPTVKHADFLAWWPMWAILFAVHGAARYGQAGLPPSKTLEIVQCFAGIWLWTLLLLAANIPFTDVNWFSMAYTIPILIEAGILSQSLRDKPNR